MGEIGSVVEPDSTWGIVVLRTQSEGEGEEDREMIRRRDWGKDLTASGVEEGRNEHKVYGGRSTSVRVVGRMRDHLLEREYVRYGEDLVKEGGGRRKIHIKVSEKNKVT